MHELLQALREMATAHGVREPEPVVRRYAGRLTGYPQAEAVRAVRSASRHNSRLPSPEQILGRLGRGQDG
jgi:hypothetical protein